MLEGNVQRRNLIRRIVFRIKPLPRGQIYPCTLQDVKRVLEKLPCHDNHLSAVKTIEFSPDKAASWAAASTDLRTRTIRIFSNPSHLWWYVGRRMPWKVLKRELLFRYEALVGKNSNGWWLWWVDRKKRRRYVLEQVLPHEIGHLVCAKRHTKSYVHNERVADGYLGYLRRRKGQGEKSGTVLISGGGPRVTRGVGSG